MQGIKRSPERGRKRRWRKGGSRRHLGLHFCLACASVSSMLVNLSIPLNSIVFLFLSYLSFVWAVNLTERADMTGILSMRRALGTKNVIIRTRWHLLFFLNVTMTLCFGVAVAGITIHYQCPVCIWSLSSRSLTIAGTHTHTHSNIASLYITNLMLFIFVLSSRWWNYL